MANVSIVWDIENVTPPGSNSFFVDALWDYAEGLGRVVSARAYCDWSKPGYQKLGLQLRKYYFYLVHVPSEKKGKNSVDIQLVTDTLELLRLYEHIDIVVLVTGDSDFRPLLLTLRRAGKINHVVCDLRNASQDLLELADEFVDYKDILPNEEVETEETKASELPPDFWFSALAETISILLKEGKPTNLGSAKIRLKMLNPQFDEIRLGYKRWGDFVSAAVRKGFVTFSQEEEKKHLIVPDSSKEKGVAQSAFKALVDALEELDGTRAPQFHEFGIVNSKLKERKIDLKPLGFSQFKKFIMAADLRRLVDTKQEANKNLVKRLT